MEGRGGCWVHRRKWELARERGCSGNRLQHPGILAYVHGVGDEASQSTIDTRPGQRIGEGSWRLYERPQQRCTWRLETDKIYRRPHAEETRQLPYPASRLTRSPGTRTSALQPGGF